MKLKIIGGVIDAEFQSNPLDKVQKQLSAISQKSELEISNLRSYIDRISKIKDSRIEKLIEEFDNRNKLEDMEIEELKSLVMGITRGSGEEGLEIEFEALKDRLKSNASSTKDIINNIEDRISRISKDNIERANRIKEEISRISSENEKKILILKKELSHILSIRGKERKRESMIKTKEFLPEHKAMKKAGVLDGRKFMGKLNYKPKLPI